MILGFRVSVLGFGLCELPEGRGSTWKRKPKIKWTLGLCT